MSTKAAKKQVLSVNLEGGPRSPGAWKKWHKDGGEAARDYFENALATLGYEGDFSLIAVQGMKGGRSHVIRLGKIISHKNAIELVLQIGSRVSKWKYELIAPKGVDVVDLLKKLENYLQDEQTSPSDKSDGNGADVISLVQEEDRSTEEKQDTVDIELSEENHTSDDDSTSAAVVSEPGQSMSVHPDLKNLEEMAAAYLAAQQAEGANDEEIHRIRQEIAERQEMIRLYEEEQAESKRILDSEEHQAAADKLEKIQAILRS